MLMAVALGFMMGWACGDEVRRRKNAEARVDELSTTMEKMYSKRPPPEEQLKRIAIVVNDAHKQISAVSKALIKPTK
jgi:hypothetical protein